MSRSCTATARRRPADVDSDRHWRKLTWLWHKKTVTNNSRRVGNDDLAPRKIMLATDLTPAGDRAFDRAVALAQQWDAELVILHVVESGAVRLWGIDQRMRNVATEMDRLVRSAKQACKIDTIGSVAERFLMTLPCDVLAVPTRK